MDFDTDKTDNYELFMDKEPEITFKSQEVLLPHDSDKDLFHNRKCWRILFCIRVASGNKLRPSVNKVWKPVFLVLEENSLKFHAQDFESSPPFKIISLTWFYSFRVPMKTQLNEDGFLFTTVLINSLHSRRSAIKRFRGFWKKVKIGCANYNTLLDLVETVQKCVASFPAFRPAGIFHKTEKMLVRVEDFHEVTQPEKHSVSKAINQERHTEKRVRIMLNVLVSASPDCFVEVKRTESFSRRITTDDICFHKCVKSRSLNEKRVVAWFSPLDDCWFELMSWKAFCTKPCPLRCEVTIAVCDSCSVAILARVFTSSTRLELTTASNITLRFYIPSEWLETEGKRSVQTIQHCTNVTKGNVSYNSSVETMLWSIPKLSFNPCRNFHLTGKPLAQLSTRLEAPSGSNTQEITKFPAEMDFNAEGNARSSEVRIASMKLGVKSFGKFKTSYSSLYRIKIPVSIEETVNDRDG
ncbi:stonin-2-like [Dendronephthya gigantea]|uniref:stonin-2-like n=1 Tax=Dendronephthya gigantea TaxID=151771 RepID=UPI00106BF96D|nr:stonin-2-like [Dendronephthya gigantea]